jgi:pSer/pThr/pTyr-binding forkhead associated (FHA) protein
VPLPAAQPRLFIWSVSGGQPLHIVPIRGERYTLGREANNDLVLDDRAVSRHHLVFAEQQGRWVVQAQPGSGITYVNGHPATEALLQPFDQVSLGMTVIRFELSGAAQRRQLTEASLRSPLLLIDSPWCHFVAPLREPNITLGRSPESGIIVPSPIVARHQARLERRPQGGYTVTDLGATNPLLFQGRPIQQHHLQDGDTLTIDAQVLGQTVVIRYIISPL